LEHHTIFEESGRFGGWPANHGLWSWGNEIVVGFQSCVFKIIGDSNHAIDKTQPRVHLQARSLDGGRNWILEKPTVLQDFTPISTSTELQAVQFDINTPKAAITFKSNPQTHGSMLQFFSTDACRSWKGPFEVSIFSGRVVEPRIDYIFEVSGKITAFLTAFKDNGEEGRVFCLRSMDSGATWRFLSWIGEERTGFNIMPSTVRLGANGFLCATRWQENGRWGIDTFISRDDGLTWKPHGNILDADGLSNPPSMIRLADGRLCVTYGYRAKPYGIRAKLSSDEGLSWTDERVLRDDGGHWDLGYTRSVQVPDGDILTVYYFCRDKSRERTIEATIWRP